MNDTSPVDHRVLDELRQDIGDAGFMRDLIDTYLEETPRLLLDLREAIARHDANAVKNTAHTLKSTSATFGACQLAALCQDLELLARQGDTAARAQQKAAHVSALFEVVRNALEAERGTG